MLHIDGKKVANFRIGKRDRQGYTEVFVNNNASCHMLPQHWVSGMTFRQPQRSSIKTGGHVYTWEGLNK